MSHTWTKRLLILGEYIPIYPPSQRPWMEGYSKLKIDRKEVRDMGEPWSHLEVKRSNVNVTRPLNAMTENQPYLQNGKGYEPQTRYTGGVGRPATPTCAVTFQVTSYMSPPPASVDLNNHTELSAWRSSGMSMKQVFVHYVCEVTQVTTCTVQGHMWRPHYRPNSLFVSLQWPDLLVWCWNVAGHSFNQYLTLELWCRRQSQLHSLLSFNVFLKFRVLYQFLFSTSPLSSMSSFAICTTGSSSSYHYMAL